MQFTHGIGVMATKPEIEALVGFAKESDDAKVTLRVRDGRFLAFAANGISGVYHHGEALDGEGKPATEDRIWQIPADTLRMLKGAMETGDELVLHTDSVCRLFQAEIREIETSKSRLRIDLDGHVSEQLQLPINLPERPIRHTGEITTPEVTFSWGVLKQLQAVTKAADSTATRFVLSSNPKSPIYVEVDEPRRLSDEEQARWVCLLMPMVIDRGDDD